MLSKLDYDCESCARELVAMYRLAEVADELVAKGLGVSEVAQIARTELRAQRLLAAAWNNRTKQAVAAASSAAARGASYKAIGGAVDSVMKRFEADVRKPYCAAIEQLYELARSAGWKKASGRSKGSLQYSKAEAAALTVPTQKAKSSGVVQGKISPEPTFDLVDDNAVEALQRQQMLWVGDHYGADMSTAIRKGAQDVMEQGLGRNESASQMRTTMEGILKGTVSPPGTFRGSSDQYFELLSANAATSARAWGQIRSFDELGCTRYELVNPMDHRTSEICRHLNGKVMLVANAKSQIASEAAAKNPTDIKRAHPWPSIKSVKALSPKAGHVGAADSAALSAGGLSLPPFHARCRTTVDITMEAMGSFEPLTRAEEKVAEDVPSSKSPVVSKTTPTDALKAGIADKTLDYLRGGMRDMSAHMSAYAGATAAEVDAIATGEMATMSSSSGTTFEPIRINVSKDGKGGFLYELQDGRHRLEAAKRAGATKISANVHMPSGKIVQNVIIPIPR